MATRENETDSAPPDPPSGDEAIQSPYDRLINRTLQQIEAARSLLELHLPEELTQHLKLATMAQVDTSFIDRNLRRRFADRLFSVDVSDEIVNSLEMRTKYAYLLVLIDHKSTDDSQTLIQMLGYIVRIWENALENHQPLMPIIPWVIYNGVRPWRSARSLDQLIPVPASWKRYVPGLEIPILDVSRMDDTTMVGEPILQLALTLLKYGREPTLDVALRPVLQLLAQTVSPQQARNLLDTIRIYVMSVNPIIGEEKFNEIVTEFWPVKPEPGSVADQLIRKGEARGETRGRVETIRILQSILGVPPSTDDSLAGKSLDEMQATIESLQQQIIDRRGD
ncbi:Rpn family recombination-promoting nuclease/putative transposase [Neorhodopirellula pilleata]|uniref:Putative transposase n=1 Tax=Neorhodopirellula pilleata TaxID=2714738 RepID=A0A5C5ZQ91_9BACT|nr:Rpn family recombination-promoting nuclease/putative transposase [Neorhodopirellula pilleata]TWT89410.1 putative transposase [Neorhodopirellula pilleata]